jgi:hypothetical protein
VSTTVDPLWRQLTDSEQQSISPSTTKSNNQPITIALAFFTYTYFVVIMAGLPYVMQLSVLLLLLLPLLDAASQTLAEP